MTHSILKTFLAIAAVAATTESAHAQFVRPNDGIIDYIDFKRDGVEIKMTHWGMLSYGYYAPNIVAERVRAWHNWLTRGCSTIRTWPLSRQIFYHAVAYSFGERRHSNPINVSWREIR